MSNDNKPDLQPFEHTIELLKEGLIRYRADITDAQIRDGLIQRFEMTYEQAHKALKRHLEYTSPNPKQIDEMSFQNMIRTANEQGILQCDWPDWRSFRTLRGKTSHTYNEEIALKVVEIIPHFIDEVVYLCGTLKERLR